MRFRHVPPQGRVKGCAGAVRGAFGQARGSAMQAKGNEAILLHHNLSPITWLTARTRP